MALLMKLFLFDFMTAEGQSMVPAIQSGAVLVVNKLAYGFRLPFLPGFLLRWSLPKEGDVVVFYAPGGDLAVKRCTGVTGEGGQAACFLRGDNGRESYDSRSYGPVPADRIIGKVIGIK